MVMRVGLWAGALHIGAVLLTQYAEGGGAEWGGRFFAAGLVFLLPAAAVVIGRLVQAMSRRAASVAAAGMVITTGLALNEGVQLLRYGHAQAAVLERSIGAAVADNPGAFVLSTSTLVAPQSMWNGIDTTRWLLTDITDVDSTIEHLHGRNVENLLVVTTDPDSVRPALAGSYTVTDETSVGQAFYLLEVQSR